jgi:hypothetical protein
VLVSRARTACGADAIVRDGVGYRLGAAPGEVDSARLAELVRAATAELDRDAAAAGGLVAGATDPAATQATAVAATIRLTEDRTFIVRLRAEVTGPCSQVFAPDPAAVRSERTTLSGCGSIGRPTGPHKHAGGAASARSQADRN